LFENPTKNVI